MDIKIKSIKLLNFKGQRNTCLEFDGQNKCLLGANATGKTSIFDAFTWVLFGKDSKGAAQFDIKTLTPEGDVIWRLPHSVTVELLVDGKLIMLRKEYEEKWVKTRGETDETFRGHEVNRFWNDVPCTAGEYDKKVAELCEESLFRLITNPSHFNSLDDKEKMRLLNMLEGNTTDEQFMATSKDFANFLNILDGKTLDEYKRELAAKAHTTNTEIATLHTRLDEVNHNMPEAQDWASIEAEIAKCDTDIARIKGLQADAAKLSEEHGKKRLQIQEAINTETFKLKQHESDIRNEINKDYYKQAEQQRDLQNRLEALQQELAGLRHNINTLTERRERLYGRLEVLKGEYKVIHSETFTFDESKGICQTCNQQLPFDDIEATRQTLLNNFNTNKAARLQANIDDGTNVQSEIKGVNDLLAKHEANFGEIEAKIKELTDNPILSQKLQLSDPASAIESDADIIYIRTKIDELQKQLNDAPVTTQANDYAVKEREIQEIKSALEKRLYIRATIESAKTRLGEIEGAIRKNSQYLLDLQHDQNTIAEIQKAKALYVESRINSQFNVVRFKMISDQVNGGERQVCETTVNGVPYQSLNNAARINAGLDIINAFCRFNDITAPVFVDNSEAVNELLPMKSQVISLRVTDDQILTLK